jgi:ATP-dependent RNA helicase TDRD9
MAILHSQMPTEAQKLAFATSEKPKIILATNIAESSVTIPDVKFVVDFCLTKYQMTDSETKLSSLELHWTSRNSCEQRAGRCGRMSEGYVYRLVFRKFYEYQMRESCVAEMVRSSMETVVLRAKVLDLGPPKAILALALDPPNETDILNTILSLKEVGALLRLNNKVGFV